MERTKKDGTLPKIGLDKSCNPKEEYTLQTHLRPPNTMNSANRYRTSAGTY